MNGWLGRDCLPACLPDSLPAPGKNPSPPTNTRRKLILGCDVRVYIYVHTHPASHLSKHFYTMVPHNYTDDTCNNNGNTNKANVRNYKKYKVKNIRIITTTTNNSNNKRDNVLNITFSFPLYLPFIVKFSVYSRFKLDMKE